MKAEMIAIMGQVESMLRLNGAKESSIGLALLAIKAADRQAREECAEICRQLAYDETLLADERRGAMFCEEKIIASTEE